MREDDATGEGDWLVPVLSRWPALVERLGTRRDVFIDKARSQAAVHCLGTYTHAATRYLNLCCALGPAFEDRPENEWALAILSDTRLDPWIRLHQLVARARRELRRRGGDEEALARSDAALLDMLDARRSAADADAEPLARLACDVEAIELTLLDMGFRYEYALADVQWTRVAVAQNLPPVRIGAQHRAPARLSALSSPAADGPGARLQLRQAIHGGCSTDRHPAVRWIDGRGLTHTAGHAARSLSWPLVAPVPAPPATGLGFALAEETAPDISLLQVPSCGLRDEGLPLGAQALQVATYPAQQWLFALHREGVATLQWPTDGEADQAPSPSLCRIERDGDSVDARAWIQGFDELLHRASVAGFTRLFEAWQGTAQRASMTAQPGWLLGPQVLTWGWREGTEGMADDAVLRVLGKFDLRCTAQLALAGELQIGSARVAARLQAAGETRAEHLIARESNDVPMLEALGRAIVRFRFPFSIEMDPIATPEAIVCSDVGLCTGALTGEAGLRPRRSGGSGWEWFVRAAVEPVMTSLTVHDPVLGQARRNLVLLPSMTVLDWSLG